MGYLPMSTMAWRWGLGDPGVGVDIVDLSNCGDYQVDDEVWIDSWLEIDIRRMRGEEKGGSGGSPHSSH